MNKKLFLVVLLTAIIMAAYYITRSVDTKDKQSSDNPVIGPEREERTTERIYEMLTVAETKELLETKKEVAVIDLRTKEEFIAGSLNDATHIDFESVDFYSKIKELDKDRIYLIYCRTYNKSLETLELMRQLEFTTVYVLGEGYLGWSEQAHKN